jgi:hypothetical protein
MPLSSKPLSRSATFMNILRELAALLPLSGNPKRLTYAEVTSKVGETIN